MTILHKKDGVTLHRNKYVCDICELVDFWSDGWSSFSSIAMEEACPSDIPTMCSPECYTVFKERIKTGQIRLPVVHPVGHDYEIRSKRKGY